MTDPSSKQPEVFELPGALLDAVFPFHFILDRGMGFMRVGTGLKKYFARSGIKDLMDHSFSDCFHIERPSAAQPTFDSISTMLQDQFDSIQTAYRSVFVLQTQPDDPIRIRGQMLLDTDHDQIIFIGSPWITSLDQLDRHGLSLRDYPPHDPIGEMLILIQAKNSAVNDLRKLNEQLQFELKEREAIATQLRHSQKLEAVGQLAGGIAHDFNNVLMAIFGYCSLSIEKTKHDQELYSNIREIGKAAERASHLTAQLLAFSRKQELHPRNLNLGTEVRDVERMLRRLIGENIQLKSLVDEDLQNVSIDPSALHQIVVNLVVNARDAMPDGGNIKIVISNRTLLTLNHSIHEDIPPGSYVQLDVTDDGTGIDPELISKIFEPFYTTKDVSEGSGLGLATVHGVVKQSGGHIDVTSQVGKGTTFSILLPVTKQEVDSEAAFELDKVKSTDSGTVLVVEDEVTIQALLKSLLQDRGYHVRISSSGEDALEFLHANGAVDLMITDIVMPGINGRELADRVNENFPGIKVIYMTGYTDDEIIRRGMSTSGLPILQKPFWPDDLFRMIDSVLKKGP